MGKIIIDLNQLKRSNWTTEETKNAETIVDFVQQLMNNHDFTYIKQNFIDHQYIQHNRSMKDGIFGVLDTVMSLVKQSPEYTYDVKHIYADGSYIIFQSHVTLQKKHRGNPNKGFNIKDTWKIENGKIVEHWDAIQPIDLFMRFYFLLTGGKVSNQNSLF